MNGRQKKQLPDKEALTDCIAGHLTVFCADDAHVLPAVFGEDILEHEGNCAEFTDAEDAGSGQDSLPIVEPLDCELLPTARVHADLKPGRRALPDRELRWAQLRYQARGGNFAVLLVAAAAVSFVGLVESLQVVDRLLGQVRTRKDGFAAHTTGKNTTQHVLIDRYVYYRMFLSHESSGMLRTSMMIIRTQIVSIYSNLR